MKVCAVSLYMMYLIVTQNFNTLLISTKHYALSIIFNLVVEVGLEPTINTVWRWRISRYAIQPFGAPWQNWTAVSWLQNRRNTVIRKGRCLGCLMGFEPTHIGITTRGLRPLDDKHHWWKRWDSNSRNTLIFDGFQDRCLKPLGHVSYYAFLSILLLWCVGSSCPTLL